MNNKTAEPKTRFDIIFPPTIHGLHPLFVRFAGLLAVGSLTWQHGFRPGLHFLPWFQAVDIILAFILVLDVGLALLRKGKLREVAVSRRFELLLVTLFLLFLAAVFVLTPRFAGSVAEFLHLGSPHDLVWNALDFFLLSFVGVQMLRGVQRLLGKSVRPEFILAVSFAGIILVTTLLLLLPNSSARADAPLSVMDAFFTATSATTLTGFMVRDPGTDFTVFGQMVILAAVQVGGLGIITFVALLSIFSARTLPLSQMVVFRQLINAPALSDVKRQIVGIVLTAGLIEAVGAALLFHFLPPGDDPLAMVRWSIFHSVSAFCNAGIALQSNSLEGFSHYPGLTLTIMALVVLGGLGFLVISDLLSYRVTRTRFFRRFSFFRRIHAGVAPGRLSVQTKIALTMTAFLLVAGFALFWAIEAKGVLREETLSRSILASGFYSVIVRTAGFNTVAIQELQNATLILFMILMVIGTNPISTGGGMKTVSFGILLLAMRAMVSRRERVEAFGRTLPARTLFAALSVFIIYVVSASLGAFLLAVFDPQFAFRDQLFEVTAALSTAGMSTGITADLSVPSKLVLCLLMFVGRIGPISLVLLVFHSRSSFTYQYPEEEVIVG